MPWPRRSPSISATACMPGAGNPPGRGRKWAPGLMCFGIHRKSDLPASPDGRRQGDLTRQQLFPGRGHGPQRPHGGAQVGGQGGSAPSASHGSVLDIALHPRSLPGRRGPGQAGRPGGCLPDACPARPRCSSTSSIATRCCEPAPTPTHPEFRTLIVRVWGFSAVFVDLPPALQDHVLARTEHGF